MHVAPPQTLHRYWSKGRCPTHHPLLIPHSPPWINEWTVRTKHPTGRASALCVAWTSSPKAFREYTGSFPHWLMCKSTCSIHAMDSNIDLFNWLYNLYADILVGGYWTIPGENRRPSARGWGSSHLWREGQLVWAGRTRSDRNDKRLQGKPPERQHSRIETKIECRWFNKNSTVTIMTVYHVHNCCRAGTYWIEEAIVTLCAKTS